MAVKKVGLQTHIWNNNLKSIALLATYPFLILGIVWAIAAVIEWYAIPEGSLVNQTSLANKTITTYWPIIIAGVFIWFTVAYFFHTKMVRSLSHSHPVTRKDEPELYNLLENLSITAGVAMPRLEIIETHARNAFASGIDTKSFTVTVTRGLLQSLSKDEVEAVLAHELTHILNRDVRLLIITIIFTGMLGFAAQIMWSQVRYGLWVGRRRSGNNKQGNSIVIFMAILAILWMGYFATLFTRFALSRRREYMADGGAVQLTRNPDAMMRALMRIAGKDQIPKMPGDVAMMCIENRTPFMGLFATHPPIEKRIKMLSETTGFAIPDLVQLKPFHAPRVERDQAFAMPQNKRDNWITRQRFKARRGNNPWSN
jgi:heat shock protein HtpX